MIGSGGADASGGQMEEVVIVSGLAAVQVVYAVYMLFLHRFLALGVDSLALIAYGGLVSAFLLLPFALAFEKKKWPERLSSMLMLQMLLVTLSGLAFQILMMLGIKMTSPAIASTMPNLAPGLIFIIAACVRFERFSIRCKYSIAKVTGTTLCLGGAIAMSILMTPQSAPNSNILNNRWILGCFYTFAAVIFLSCNSVLQAATMISFPAPLSLVVVTTVLGSIVTATARFVLEGDIGMGSSSLGLESIVSLVLAGATVSCVCIAFQTWCLKKKGPVMVSIFSPVQTVCSALLSAIVLGQVIDLGSIAGMLVMFGGLYVVLWAKKKEDRQAIDGEDGEANILDVQKALLS